MPRCQPDNVSLFPETHRTVTCETKDFSYTALGVYGLVHMSKWNWAAGRKQREIIHARRLQDCLLL